MNCEQVTSYLPGHAGGDVRPEAAQAVEAHVATCAGCRAEAERFRSVQAGLASLRERDVEPPPYLLEAVLEGARAERKRRLLPLVPPLELVRLVQENRDVIVSAAGAALVVAGAAYALWRAARALRPQAQAAR